MAAACVDQREIMALCGFLAHSRANVIDVTNHISMTQQGLRKINILLLALVSLENFYYDIA